MKNISEQIRNFFLEKYNCLSIYDESSGSEQYFFTVMPQTVGWLALPSIFEVLRVDTENNKIFVCVTSRDFQQYTSQLLMF